MNTIQDKLADRAVHCGDRAMDAETLSEARMYWVMARTAWLLAWI